MDTPNATRANNDLWSYYIEQQWSPVLALFGGAPAAAVLGTVIANTYALFFGDAIGRMFALNAPPVTRFVEETAAAEDSRPAPESAPVPEPAEVVPPWLRAVLEEIDERAESEREAERARELQPVG